MDRIHVLNKKGVLYLELFCSQSIAAVLERVVCKIHLSFVFVLSRLCLSVVVFSVCPGRDWNLHPSTKLLTKFESTGSCL